MFRRLVCCLSNHDAVIVGNVPPPCAEDKEKDRVVKLTVSFPAEEIDPIPRDDDESVDDDSMYTTASAGDNHESNICVVNNNNKTPSMKSSKQRHKTPYHPSKTGMILHNDGALEQVSPPTDRAMVLATGLLPSPSSSSTTTTTTSTTDSPVSFFEGLRLRDNNATASGTGITTTFVGLPSGSDDDYEDDEKTPLMRRGKKRKSSMSSSTWSTLTHEGSSPESFVTAVQGDGEKEPTVTPATPTTTMMNSPTTMQAATPTISNLTTPQPSLPLETEHTQYYTAAEDSPLSTNTVEFTRGDGNKSQRARDLRTKKKRSSRRVPQ
eukprot:scaffold9371_cov211-Amphora_coffeaeformis.AAC.7